MTTVTKSLAETELDRAWAELLTIVESVPSAAVTQPGVVENWSLKDLLGHIAFWSGRACETLRCATAGRFDAIPIGEGDNWVDEWNEREYNARKDHPFTEVRVEWMRNHQNATRALDDTPEEVLGQELRGQPLITEFGYDTYEHYRQHAEHIRDWLRALETTEA
ncbi:MAG: DinB family protein [Dehalococcoidia bacterium]